MPLWQAEEKTRMIWKITKGMDVTGIVMLMIAGACLGASVWFQDFLLTGLFLKAFFPALMVAAGVFISARLVDLTVFLIQTPASAAGARAVELHTELRLVTTPAAVEAMDDAA